MKHSTRSRRVRQRRRTGKIQRHQDQPMLWPKDERPVFRNRQVRLHVQQRGEITPYGGLSLAHDLAMRLGLDRDINDSMEVLRLHLPYFDSDHLLTHVYNQYVGGTCIEVGWICKFPKEVSKARIDEASFMHTGEYLSEDDLAQWRQP